MRLVTLQFGNHPTYQRCIRVLEYTAKKNSPKTPLEVRRVEVDPEECRRLLSTRLIIGHDVNNAIKTRIQKEIIEQAEDGEVLCLLDADIFITGDVSTVLDILPNDFDLALTAKKNQHESAPINTGVVFVRVSDKTRKWFAKWKDTAFAFLGNPRGLKLEKKKYLGINQSSLAVMMREPHDLKIEVLPCEIWNSTTSSWSSFSAETKIVHVLGQLRMTIFNRAFTHKGSVAKLSKLWKNLEKEAKEQNAKV